MIEGILGLVGGVASAAINSGWQAANYYLNLENLRWQKQQGERQFKLASAGRTDAYGNKQKYDELLNEWKLAMTPTQNKIVKAGESEQLRSLTEDAARNRKIRVRQAERGNQAAEDYTDTRAAYLYDKPKDELATRGELQSLLQGVSQGGTQKKMKDIGNTAIRQGRGAMLSQILAKGQHDSTNEWAENLLKARGQAAQETAGKLQQHEARYLPQLERLQQTMDMGGDMPQRFSQEPQRLAAEQGQQAALIQQALASASQGVNAAQAQLTKATSEGGVDMKGLASLLGKFGGSPGTAFGGSGRVKYKEPDALVDNFSGSF